MKRKNPIVSIYWESTRPLRLLTIPVGILTSLGIYLKSDNPLDNVTLINSVAPWYVWASILLSISLYRLYVLIVPESTCDSGWTCLYARSVLGMIGGVLGIIIWSIISVSSIAAMGAGLNVVLIVFSIIEVWILSRALVAYNYADTLWKRKIRNE